MDSDIATWLQSENTTQTEKHTQAVLVRVEIYCRTKGWAEAYFSKIAAGDDTVIRRMRTSGRVTAKVMARVERYLDREGAA